MILFPEVPLHPYFIMYFSIYSISLNYTDKDQSQTDNKNKESPLNGNDKKDGGKKKRKKMPKICKGPPESFGKK